MKNANRLMKVFNEVLAPQGVYEMSVEYSGSNDSSDQFDVDVRGLSVPIESLPKVDLLRPTYECVDGAYKEIDREVSVDIETLLLCVSNEIINHFGHGGWENGSGGEGTLTIRPVDGQLVFVLEHSSYETTQSDAIERELQISDVPEVARPATVRLIEWMKSSNIPCVTGEYSGEGDSGGTEIVYFPNGANLRLLEGTLTAVWGKSTYSSGSYAVEFKELNMKVEDWVKLVINVVSEKISPSWENGQGASGTVEFYADGAIKVTHIDYSEDSNTNEHTFSLSLQR